MTAIKPKPGRTCPECAVPVERIAIDRLAPTMRVVLWPCRHQFATDDLPQEWRP